MTRALTLEGLKDGARKQFTEDSGESRCYSVWAPEMHYIDGAWHVYHTAGPFELSDQRAHVLRSGSNPCDSYTYRGRLRTDRSIDTTILIIGSDNSLVYSGFDPTGRQSLLIAPMTSASTTGDTIVLSMPMESWELAETPVNEGPQALHRGGRTMLSFSGSYCWTSSYALGLLTYDGSGDQLDATSWTKSGPHFSIENGE